MGDTRLEPLVLSGDERSILRNWARRRSAAQGLAKRAAIVLACADGLSNTAVAARLATDRTTVRRWRTRFLAERLDGLSDEPRPGVPRTITDAQVEEVVVRKHAIIADAGNGKPDKSAAPRLTHTHCRRRLTTGIGKPPALLTSPRAMELA